MRGARFAKDGDRGGAMNSLTLASRLDLPAAAPLHAAILARRGAELRLDAGAVSHLGTLCLQVLIAAAAEWRDGGHSLTVAPVSDAFAATLATFGMTPDAVQSMPAPAADPAPSPETATWA